MPRPGNDANPAPRRMAASRTDRSARTGSAAAGNDIPAGADPDAKADPAARPTAPLTAMRAETLQRIERAVLQLFAEHDFHDVSLIDVARTANVSLQTIYKYFGSKESLLYAMLDVMLSRLAVRMIDHLQGIDGVRERLRKTFWVMLDYMDREPAVIQLLYTSVPMARHRHIRIYESPALMSAFLGVLKDGQKRGVLNDRVSSKILLDVFLGLLSRLVLMHLVRGEKRPLLDQFDELFTILWRALSRPEDEAATAPVR